MATKVKRYDPNEYNFGKFAETMNNNYAIERTQNLQGGTPSVNGQPSPSPIGATPTGAGGFGAVNPVNIGGTTNSQTLGNLNPSGVNLGGAMGQSVGTVHSFGTAERYQGITSGFKSLLGDLDKGKVASLDSVALGEGEKAPATEQQTIGNVASSAVNATATGVNAAVNAVNPPSENVTGTGTRVETGTGAETSGEPTLPAWLQSAIERFKIEANTQVESGAEKLDFETWQSLYSVDPVKEYQAAQRQLDYEFKTWMSNYGARAEQLYQMGLSNSGVSDIYGANAYTAYIQSSIELKRAQIEQQQENKQLYQQYSDEYEAALAAKTEATNNRISSAFSTFMSSYTPENSESIYNALLGMNMSESEALQVIQNLDRYYNSIPEDQRASTIQSNTLVTNAYNAYKGTYTPSMKAAVEADLRAQGMDEGQIASVVSMLDSFYNSLPEDQRPDVVAGGAKVDEAFSWMVEQYNSGVTDIETLIAQVKAIYGEDIGAKAAEKFMPFATTEQVDSATIINDAALEFASMTYINNDGTQSYYTGTPEQKNQIKKLLQHSEYAALAPYYEQIIALMDSQLETDQNATIDTVLEDIKNTKSDSLIFSTAEDLVTSTENQYGNNSDQYNKIVESVQAKTSEAIEKLVLSYPSNIDEFATRLGIDPEAYTVEDSRGNDINWNSADEDQKRIIVDSVMTELYNNKVISQKSYLEYMRKSISLNINESDDLKGLADIALKMQDYATDTNIQNQLERYIARGIHFTKFKLNNNWDAVYMTNEKGQDIKFHLGSALNLDESEIEANNLTENCLVKYGDRLYYYHSNFKVLWPLDYIETGGYTDAQENAMIDLIKLSVNKTFAIQKNTDSVKIESGSKLTANGKVGTKKITLPNGEVVIVEDKNISVK